MCYAVLESIKRTLPCINTNVFRILYWHVNFYDLNHIEEVWNESLPNNEFSPLWYSVRRDKS